MTALDLIFMGSPDFSIPALQALLDAGHRVSCVYAQPPRPANRGHKETPCPVHAFALEQGLTVRTPKSLKDPADQAAFATLKADAAVVVAYGLILPQAVLDAPRLGCLNIHASLLPRWRGAAPIQRAIQAGDHETGVTIMQMDAGLDTGDMLLTGKLPITDTTTAGALHDDLSALGAKLIVTALEGLEAGTLPATPQPDAGVTYAAKLDKAEGRLDWTKPAAELARTVRAFDPWPGTWFEVGKERIKVLAAEAVDGDDDVQPGTVLDDRATIQCGAGALRPTRLQRPGKGAMDAGDFLRGFDLPQGSRL
ncbi:MAG: methionyl-tRNA formyltransferase [Rhodospirillaceae bacterium]|nr:methionyl-tRNA formyltransferase [Magnetovibrio sp.]MAY67895.1 methionyl-tRNA formyltransferase [Rhodospirillaceae bacterium]|tara:strand:+ start:720 stop:1646 length:927 start_codon:yes stop_codon:yes gene_type:complete